ncbi:MAG: glutamine-hydrolyzing carbamoyl-phosphate synthase small subunit [Parvularcula sp.]
MTTARLVLAGGTVLEGFGFGATGSAVGEVCFNTAMTGYQEILTDPSYAQQIITFTAPHIGNVGTNDEDVENATDEASTAARGAVVRARITNSSNYRARLELDSWMRRRGIVGISGVDTRALTAKIREEGMAHGVISHQPSGIFDVGELLEKAKSFAGLEGADLAAKLGGSRDYEELTSDWQWPNGFEAGQGQGTGPRVVVIDYGVKRNILRRLVGAGCQVSVVPPKTSAADILARKPDGVVLSNGPGDPAATASYAAPVIKALLEAQIPMFGICLGHQLLALAIGAKTVKMAQGHHGANHPVKDHRSEKVEIVSMNHGFAVDGETLPECAEITHTSLFDGTNAGLRIKGKPVMSVQHHPEASPGPQDSFGVFDEFVRLIGKAQAA